MKNIFTTGILFLALFTFISQPFAMEAVKNNTITLLTPEQAQEYIKETKNFFLLDVRTQGEYAEKNLEGSILIPLQELNTRVNEIPKDKEILIYCRSGRRAQEAAQIIAPTLPNTSKIFVVNGFPLYPAS